MKITLIVTGKLQENFLKEGTEHYLKRLKHYTRLEVVEVNVSGSGKSPEELKETEGSLILQKIPESATVFLLDDNGKQYSSVEFSDLLQARMNEAVRQLVFIIGGAYGFSSSCYDRANGLISLGRLTFPHQLVRLIFLEQLYRGFTIIKGEKYHHA